ncbi:nucleolar protein of 40 kDa-like [Acanthaster planci]|uniref:Nucleolar protein of 40 kDa-like n=1 Tax=Acanthaster planci TaxID=133434 RepID=A0A8B7YES2_ACAPL|nr:nucleolar protein of 40 kDa-like [Acanthaster planci]
MSVSYQRKHGQTGESRQSEAPELYSIFDGEVVSIQSYGAFVNIPGFHKNGLVHKTQISSARVEDVSEVLALGDRVFCKVISLGEDDNSKISLSMKFVDQGQGKDLDPNLVQMKQEEQRRKKGRTFVQPKIELGAVFNTVCKKCGTKGHLAKDCFQMPGTKTYDLLPDEDDAVLQLGAKEIPTLSPPKKKKKKKEKKKKSKKHRHQSVSSDSSECESASSGDRHPNRHSHKHRRTSKDSKRSEKHHPHRSPGSDSSDNGSVRDRRSHKHPHKRSHMSRESKEKLPTRHRRSPSTDLTDSSDRHDHKHYHTSPGKQDRKSRKRHIRHHSDGSASSDEDRYGYKHRVRHRQTSRERHPQSPTKPHHLRDGQRKENSSRHGKQRRDSHHEGQSCDGQGHSKSTHR